ncbi:MAG: TIGR04211 family SH3 domain-containing protein [Magnetococcus sp. DMHC-6]
MSDDCRFTMRRGPDTVYKVASTLATGDRLEVLEKKNNGWVRVRNAAGEDGWAVQRFLTSDPPTKVRLDEALEELSRSPERQESVRKQVEELHTCQETQKKLRAELAEIRELSKDALALQQAKVELTARVKSLLDEVEQLKREKYLLDSRSDTLFFLSGAGVLVLGLIGGAVLARRRRGGYGQLN